MKDKIVAFEEITGLFQHAALLYCIFGYTVYFARISWKCKDKKWMRWLRKKGRISSLGSISKINFFDGFDYDAAYENIEEVYSEVHKNFSAIEEKLITLYNDSDIVMVLKKKMTREVARFFYINELASKIYEKNGFKPFLFILANGVYLDRDRLDMASSYLRLLRIVQKTKPLSLRMTEFRFPFWYCLMSFLQSAVTSIGVYLKLFGLLLFLFYCSLFKRLHPNEERAKYRFAISIMALRRQFSNDIQKVDFLLDGINITKENTLFFYDRQLDGKRVRYFKENGLSLFHDFLRNVRYQKQLITRMRREVLWVLSKGPLMLYSLNEGVFESLLFYFLWQGFSEKFEVENLITFHDFNAESICRNIILKQSLTRTKTWFYLDAANFSSFFRSKSQNKPFRLVAFMYLNYDYFLSWSEEATAYIRSHSPKMGKYLLSGCIWSEHVTLIQKKVLHSFLAEKIRDIIAGKAYKVIAVFDSGYTYISPDSYDYGVRFAQDILSLSKEIPDTLIVFKEKKARSFVIRYCPQLAELYREMSVHPRFFFPPDASSTSEIIALSDLTISFPYTSTTIEALAARKKGIFYDPSGRLQSLYYDTIPDLVCHDYNSLLKATERLLNETQETQYDAYLNRYIKGAVEPFLDGKGITRMRSFLAETKAVSEA